jgi:hypothetical protein
VPRSKVSRFVHFRYLTVGVFNFIFANVIFALFWHFNNEKFTYWKIASIVTVINAIFSYTSQNILTFKQKNHSLKSFSRYLFTQILWLPLGIICVPRMAIFFELPIVFIQLLFTIFIISVNWLLLTSHTSKILS